jgi:hypothetical protein
MEAGMEARNAARKAFILARHRRASFHRKSGRFAPIFLFLGQKSDFYLKWR